MSLLNKIVSVLLTFFAAELLLRIFVIEKNGFHVLISSIFLVFMFYDTFVAYDVIEKVKNAIQRIFDLINLVIFTFICYGIFKTYCLVRKAIFVTSTMLLVIFTWL